MKTAYEMWNDMVELYERMQDLKSQQDLKLQSLRDRVDELEKKTWLN